MSTNKENNLLNKKNVYDLTAFSHLDFPDHLSCIVWLVGCNMRCDYCYNKDIVFSNEGKLSFDDILSFLNKRIGLLDAVVISGGEATGHDLIPFCKEVKKLGFLIKLDTNGLNFEHLKKLLNLNLIDYIALDYKAPKYKFSGITHSNKFSLFGKTLDYLINIDFPFEVRTTIHSDLLDEKDINFICKDLKQRGYNRKYYLQNFADTGDNIGKITQSSKTFDKSLLSNHLEIVWR